MAKRPVTNQRTIKRFIVPITAGVLAVIFGALVAAYFAQISQQDSLIDKVAALNVSVNQKIVDKKILETLGKDVLEASSALNPVIGNAEYCESIMSIITNVATTAPYYMNNGINPVLTIQSDTGNIASQTMQKETIGNTAYGVLVFKIIIDKIDINSLVSFLNDLQSVPTLKTLVIRDGNIVLQDNKANAIITVGVYIEAT